MFVHRLSCVFAHSTVAAISNSIQYLPYCYYLISSVLGSYTAFSCDKKHTIVTVITITAASASPTVHFVLCCLLLFITITAVLQSLCSAVALRLTCSLSLVVVV
jgi:hypothetical protein